MQTFGSSSSKTPKLLFQSLRYRTYAEHAPSAIQFFETITRHLIHPWTQYVTHSNPKKLKLLHLLSPWPKHRSLGYMHLLDTFTTLNDELKIQEDQLADKQKKRA